MYQQTLNDIDEGRLATKKDWIGLAVLTLPCLIVSMDLTVLNLAIPAITRDLRPSGSQILWIIDIYGFMVAGALVTMGILGDRLGRRKILMWGGTFFGIVSVFASTVKTPEMLIFARAALGISAATLAPSTLSLIRNIFHNPGQRQFAIGVWAGSFATGSVLGPLIGGAVLEFAEWGAVFLLAVPVMVVLLILGPIVLPEFKDESAGRIDFLSSFLSLSAVLPVIYGMKKFATVGFNPYTAIPVVFGLFMGWLFVKRQKSLTDPMIDIGLFSNSRFSTSLLVNITCVFVTLGFFLFAGQVYQLILGQSPLETGLWMAPPGILIALLSVSAAKILTFWSPRKVLILGMLSAAVGFAVLAFLPAYPYPVTLLIGSSIYCMGLGPMATVTSDLIVTSAPPEKTGVASAMSETAAEFGGALGIATLGTIITAVYRKSIGEYPFTSLLPEPIVKGAMESLGEAIEVSRALAPQQAEMLVEASKAAMLQGMATVAIVCSIISLSCALLVRLAFNANTGEKPIRQNQVTEVTDLVSKNLMS